MTPAGLPVWLNGRILDQAEARIDPADRGLLLGDGLFETMRVTDGAVRHFTLHMERLAHGAGVLMFPPPDTDMIAQAVRDLLAACGLQGGSLRLTLTRGPGPRGLLPPPQLQPTLLLAAAASLPPATPVRLVTASHRRDEDSVLSRIKSLNYLPSILARMEAAMQGADDALLLNRAGHVAETSASTLVAVIGGKALTPPVSDGALPGIARGMLLAAGLVCEGHLTPAMLRGADAVFSLNSLCAREVVAIDGYELPRQPAFLARLVAYLDG
ncbi:aminotransferase class IV [Komagataeibacter sucrofermentans]|uniref:Probable branched-chain-amino-acid aminotransferase n=1 Tax=Komagataeibacter sucrofermentans TaxID=1053551 RepID=A0A318QKT8_9PROT|nr:aminotransferase class IV [Komagataeibacter sucrofermentans]PYD79665.1 2-keto-4-methylthiobutyrate aminotransferase [Komagataeibacter sucrofermentans]GBQ43937.1 aminotransferase [Komagataeibacter sucrofermentans DSM 15973]